MRTKLKSSEEKLLIAHQLSNSVVVALMDLQYKVKDLNPDTIMSTVPDAYGCSISKWLNEHVKTKPFKWSCTNLTLHVEGHNRLNDGEEDIILMDESWQADPVPDWQNMIRISWLRGVLEWNSCYWAAWERGLTEEGLRASTLHRVIESYCHFRDSEPFFAIYNEKPLVAYDRETTYPNPGRGKTLDVICVPLGTRIDPNSTESLAENIYFPAIISQDCGFAVTINTGKSGIDFFPSEKEAKKAIKKLTKNP